MSFLFENNGRFHKNDRRNFFVIARGSAFECIPLISLCAKKGLGSRAKTEELRKVVDGLEKVFSVLVKGDEKHKA
jgi:four helix bundle protein